MTARPWQHRVTGEEALVEIFANRDSDVSDSSNESDWEEESCSEESLLKENIEEDNGESSNNETPVAGCILLC